VSFDPVGYLPVLGSLSERLSSNPSFGADLLSIVASFDSLPATEFFDDAATFVVLLALLCELFAFEFGGCCVSKQQQSNHDERCMFVN
jgi:hypothetical protein